MFVIISAEGQPSQRVALSTGELSIGRDPRSDIVLPSASVSATHARLFLRDGRVIIRDLGSTNGTSVNGRPLARPTLLNPVDVVRIGPYLLQLSPD